MRTARLLILSLFLLVTSAAADAGPPGQHPLLRYARDLFLAELGFGGPAVPPTVENAQRGCFVTFFSGRRVIACFGGFQPRKESLLREIEANVAGALRNDPRARDITRETALKAGVQITFPGQLIPIQDYSRFDPRREGLFVENDLTGVAIVPGEAKTAAWAWREARRRLGVDDPAGLRLYKFRADFLTTRESGQ